jgi:hypothetical protein
MRPLTAFAAASIATALLIGCSSSSDGDSSAAAGSGGSSSAGAGGSGAGGSGAGGSAGSSVGGSGGTSAGGSGGGTTGYTLDTVCAQVTPKICAGRKSCCTTEGAFDEAKCEAFELMKCQANVAEVKAGTMTFDGSHIDECLTKIQPLLDGCVATIPIIEKAVTDLKLCNTIFQGKKMAGDACTEDAQCAQPTAAGSSAGCDAKTNQCSTTTFADLGAACAFGAPANTFCKSGLYCDADFTKNPVVGTCKTATALGATCDKTKVNDLECGLGFYCEGTSSACVKAKDGGAACTGAIECQSLACTIPMGAKAGTCAPLDPLVKSKECGAM